MIIVAYVLAAVLAAIVLWNAVLYLVLAASHAVNRRRKAAHEREAVSPLKGTEA